MVSMFLSHHEAALDQLQRARRLSPIGKATNRSDVMTAYAHFFLGDDGEAVNWASKVLRKEPNMVSALGVAAMANALAGNVDEARKFLVRLRQILPALRLDNLGEYF
jgi:uncharacterized membrane-anchored protein